MFETEGLSVKFLKKEPYSGSYCGMRYTIQTSEEGLVAFVYPEPWSLEHTPQENLIQKVFPFTPEGVDDILSWMESLYKEKRRFWEQADKDKMSILLHG